MDQAGFLKLMDLRTSVEGTMKSYFRKYLTPQMEVYDVGCGSKPFKSFMEGKVKAYIGVDVADGFYGTDAIDLIGDANNIPLPDESADAMISCQVLEHLERPLDALTEAHRVLKKGGLFFIAFPFLYPMHAVPRDYTRFTEYAMDVELKKRGFEILERENIGGFWFSMAMFVRIYLQTFDRGFLKKTKLVPVLIWLQQVIFYVFHRLEEWGLKAAGKKPGALRDIWTINYIYVVKKA